MLTRRRLTGLVVFVFACLSWTGSVRAVPTAVTYWNDVALQAVTAGRTAPAGLLDQALVAAAAYGVLAGLYPSQLPGPTGLTQKYNDFVTANNLAGDPGLGVGADAAAALLTQYRPAPNPPLPPYQGGTDPGEWRPTFPAFATGAFEFAAYTTPFTLLRPSQFRPQGPPPLKSEQYRRDYDEVKALGSATGSTRTPEQTDMAHFWSENFTAQWPRAIRAIVEAHVPDVGDSARLFALSALSAADAFISCWESKYHFNFWRPITAIREGENDGNPRTAGSPTWSSLLATPPYPDYTSGANNLTGAYTKTLELFFDTDNFDFVVTSTAALAQQKVREFHRFSDAAAEVVEARILLGIHFRFADDEARAQGRHVAHWVFQKFLRPVR